MITTCVMHIYKLIMNSTLYILVPKQIIKVTINHERFKSNRILIIELFSNVECTSYLIGVIYQSREYYVWCIYLRISMIKIFFFTSLYVYTYTILNNFADRLYYATVAIDKSEPLVIIGIYTHYVPIL